MNSSSAPEPIMELQPPLDAALQHSHATSSMPHTVLGTNSATLRPPLQAPNRQPRNKLSTIRTPINPPPHARPEQGPRGSAGSFPSPCFRSDYGNSAEPETATGQTNGRPHGAFRQAGSAAVRGGHNVKVCPNGAGSRGHIPPDPTGQLPALPALSPCLRRRSALHRRPRPGRSRRTPRRPRPAAARPGAETPASPESARRRSSH